MPGMKYGDFKINSSKVDISENTWINRLMQKHIGTPYTSIVADMPVKIAIMTY